MIAGAGGAVGVGAASRWEFEAIGTRWRIDTAAPLTPEARTAVAATIDAFDRAWSRFRPDSLVTALARGAQDVPLPPDAAAMLAVYDELARASGGAVNPLIGNALARRGYDAALSLVDGGAQSAPHDWRARLTQTGGRLALTEPATIDVGAVGKGRLVDLVLDALAPSAEGEVAPWTQGGIVVDAGGDLAVRGRTERIGLEHPYDPARAIGVWELADAALCASAGNRRAWTGAAGETLHHVLDARTGEPVRTIVATWAVASDAMTADAVATALFFDGGPELAHAWSVEWVRMTSDGRVEWSPGCRAELFLRR